MAIQATTCWRMRAGGGNTNGGGYDPSISGAGTDYTDQDAAQLSLTDLATSGAGSTTLTSSTGGFTSAMKGNCIRISAGTNFQTGYYFITARTDTNTVTLDRTPTSGGAGSGGSGKLGGAFATFEPFATFGGLAYSAAAITSPLDAGHTIYMRGSGSDFPTSPDIDYSGPDGYYQFPNGTATAPIRLVGYNGRPRLDNRGLFFYTTSFWWTENLYIKISSAGGNATSSYGMVPTGWLKNSILDCNGCDMLGITGALGAWNNWLKNSGSNSAGTSTAITGGAYGIDIFGNRIDGWRGYGARIGLIGVVSENIIENCGLSGIYCDNQSPYGINVTNNTVYNNAGCGILLHTPSGYLYNCSIRNNIIMNNGEYGLKCDDGTTAQNDAFIKGRAFHNAYKSNVSGSYYSISAGTGDVSLSADPFTNAGAGDFSLNNTSGAGAACRAAGYPGAFPDALTTSYLDIGAVQHAEPTDAEIATGVWAYADRTLTS